MSPNAQGPRAIAAGSPTGSATALHASRSAAAAPLLKPSSPSKGP